jgi:hypothetical protein
VCFVGNIRNGFISACLDVMEQQQQHAPRHLIHFLDIVEHQHQTTTSRATKGRY